MTSNCEKDMDLPVYETFYDGITPYKVYINDEKGYISIYGVTKKISWVDSDGEETSNFTLAERRAKVIRDILRKKGVPRAQIITESKGETEPTAPNDTDTNRRLNRRVEVKLN